MHLHSVQCSKSNNSSAKSLVGASISFWCRKDFLYLPHHQLWYDLTQLMHNLPIFGLDYEHRTDHVFPQFKVLQGGIKSIARKPHQQFFWASLILCIQMYQTRMEIYLSNSLKSNYKRIMGHALLHYICPIIISDNCGLGTIHMN